MSDGNYFCATVEGEAPNDLSLEEVREQLNENLPGWCDAYLNRFDGGPTNERV